MLFTKTTRQEATAPLPIFSLCPDAELTEVRRSSSFKGNSCFGSSRLEETWETTSWWLMRRPRRENPAAAAQSQADAGGTQRLAARAEAGCSPSMLIPCAAHCNALHIRRVTTKKRVSAAALTRRAPFSHSDVMLDGGTPAACLLFPDKCLPAYLSVPPCTSASTSDPLSCLCTRKSDL